eukprot:jgi/Psemu1/244639/estExt_Genewise1.C_4850004
MNSSSRRKTVSGSNNKTDATRKRIERMEEEREERRKEMIQKKLSRKEKSQKLLAAGNPGDVDFIGMVEEWRMEQDRLKTNSNHHHNTNTKPAPRNSNIIVAVRKRPMFEKERVKLDHDSVSCYDPKVWIHSAKFKVDGITKYLTHTGFQFDHAFGEDSSTDQIYLATTMPLVDHVVRTKGRATVFCYGQTGSGKTHTMSGIQQILAHDLYAEMKAKGDNVEIRLAFFELYSGYVQDLLHDRKRCKLLEDGKGEVNITGLQEVRASTAEDFLRVIEEGHSQRTTRSTEANDTSSRSHAICQVFLRNTDTGKLQGKLTLVDLAGSERGSDTKSHDSKRRSESAEINTSLLSLKECIRALGQKGAHVPYRGSKLTLILKDCFSPDSKTTMIAMVSPGASSTDHSLNTLRYADRIKEQRLDTLLTEEYDEPDTLLTQEYDEPDTLTTQEYDEPNSPNILSSEDEDEEEEEEDDDDEDENEEEFVPAEDQNDIAPLSNEEAEMRRTVQILFELEESLLDQHISNIKENAEMLRLEDSLLQTVEQVDDTTDDEMDNYAIQLAEFLDRKEELLLSLQSKLDKYKMYSAREQQLAEEMQALAC